MRISELVEYLNTIKASSGDIEVYFMNEFDEVESIDIVMEDDIRFAEPSVILC